MIPTVPEGARAAARVILLDENDRLLYLRAHENSTGKAFWVMPGGGLDQSESFENAAVREVREETGLEIDLGPCVWFRHHTYSWERREHNQFEVFFVARTPATDIGPWKQDVYISGHRWWTLAELKASKEVFSPRNVATLLEPILAGCHPSEPFDCGV